jgi:hypothetical protein
VRGSKTEYDKFKDADASYQDRESYKIVVEPMSSMYVHECPPIELWAKVGDGMKG